MAKEKQIKKTTEEENPRVSLQILNANRVGELGELLTSLLFQTYTEWDLILRDESTTPSIQHEHINKILTLIKTRKHGVIYKHDKSYSNIGKSRNMCYELDTFKNDLIIRIDDDSICEPDYILKLVRGYQKAVKEGYKVGGVGGLVPPMPVTRLEQVEEEKGFVTIKLLNSYTPIIKKRLPKIFNEIVFNNEGNFIIEDDGGQTFYFKKDEIVPSHHLRSSFLFTREVFEKMKSINGYGHPIEYGFNGFREETVLTMKMRWLGYDLFTVDAKCYHLQSNGGSRQHSQAEYNELVQINDKNFREWCKKEYVENGGWRN